jgi:hypothetical protein
MEKMCINGADQDSKEVYKILVEIWCVLSTYLSNQELNWFPSETAKVAQTAKDWDGKTKLMLKYSKSKKLNHKSWCFVHWEGTVDI